MRIDINLATHPYEDSRRFWSYWGTGLTMLSLATLLLLYFAVTGFLRAQADRSQISKLQAEINAYDQEKSRAEGVLNQPQNREMREQSRFLNALFQRKALSWTRVFEDLEQVMPAHLHVISIHPDVASDNNVQIKLTVGGDSLEQAQDLVRKMENSNHFRGTQIKSERFASEQGGGAQDRVQFEIDALYSPISQANAVSGGMN